MVLLRIASNPTSAVLRRPRRGFELKVASQPRVDAGQLLPSCGLGARVWDGAAPASFTVARSARGAADRRGERRAGIGWSATLRSLSRASVAASFRARASGVSGPGAPVGGISVTASRHCGPGAVERRGRPLGQAVPGSPSAGRLRGSWARSKRRGRGSGEAAMRSASAGRRDPPEHGLS